MPKRPRDGHLLAEAIVDTIREPLLVLDEDLRVVTASRSFYLTFQATPENTQGRMLYDLGEGEWNIAALRLLLERIVPEHSVMEDFEVETTFPRLGHRTMLLNARKVFYEGNSHTTLLLSFEDVTERRRSEEALKSLLEQKNVLLAEMSHRIANSLQIIASILLIKARMVQSEEIRLHLQDAHSRVISVASLQQQLQGSGKDAEINVGSYLSKLCETLGASMIEDHHRILLKVVAGEGTATSDKAVSLGLIVTELVINALKHAFTEDVRDGHVVIGYEVDGSDWKLSVSDNGGGMPEKKPDERKSGLGTAMIAALAQQLDAQVEIDSSLAGTTVSVVHATFTSHLPTTAPTIKPAPSPAAPAPPTTPRPAES